MTRLPERIRHLLDGVNLSEREAQDIAHLAKLRVFPRATPAPAPAFTDLLRQNHSCAIQAGKPLCRFSEAQDGEWVHITDLRRWIGERPAPAPVTVSAATLDAMCAAYDPLWLSRSRREMALSRERMVDALEAYESARGSCDHKRSCRNIDGKFRCQRCGAEVLPPSAKAREK